MTTENLLCRWSTLANVFCVGSGLTLRPSLLVWTLCLASWLQGLTSATAALPSPQLNFQRDVRPILSDYCFPCHGPDEKERKGKMRLDTRDGAVSVRDGKAAVIPGQASQSELWKRITSQDADDIMPPPKFRRKLEEKHISVLKRWIDEGAEYGVHWAFKSVKRPNLTHSDAAVSKRSPLDVIVESALKSQGLKASPQAEKSTLIRRLSLDLIGLPPTSQEVDSYLKDTNRDAYRRLVERLLKSPHFGERWARVWLDAARYADSDGFEKDKSRNVWFYRDWVISSFNEDLPYDQFIVHQLAGDLVEQPTQDSIVATGFLRNSMINEEGGVDPEQFRMDAMFDRMDAIGKSMLGLTIQCAQCHTHKYDPLSHEEYYRLFAYLNNVHEEQRVVYTREEREKIARIRAAMVQQEEELKRRHPDWNRRLSEWETKEKFKRFDWQVIRPYVEDLSTGGQKYLPQEDGSFLAQSYAPTKHTAKLILTNQMAEIRSFRLELLNDPNLPANGPGRSFIGTSALTEFMVEAADAKQPANKVWAKFAKATADYSNPVRDLEPNFYDKSDKKRVTGPVSYAIDGNQDTAWGIDAGPGRRNQPRQAVFVADRNLAFPNGTILTIHLAQNHGGWNSDDHMNNNLGRFRISISGSDDVAADLVPTRVREVLNRNEQERSQSELNALFSYWLSVIPEFSKYNEAMEKLWSEWPEGTTALTVQERSKMRTTSVLKRGDWLQPGMPVDPAVPAFLQPMPTGHPQNRLGLARWIASENAPTTARVFVNRVWQAIWGSGLVATPEDFGLQGESPSHPELLDWMAYEFMNRNWSVKELIRIIVLSDTYKQSSRMTAQQLAKDPQNRWLGRGARFRVEAEVVRDIALTSSGLLNPKVGGKSVFAPAPEFLFLPPTSYAPFPWKEELGGDRYRRALYTFRRRSTPYPALQAFDAPNGDFACVKRSRSNNALQALTGLNEALFVESAQALSRKTVEFGGKSDVERINYAFNQVLGRDPETGELKDLQALVKKQRSRLGDGWVSAAEVAYGRSEVPKSSQTAPAPIDLAVFTVVSRVLLNLDETITRE